MGELTIIFVLGLLIGVILGFFLGRTRAEWGRARFDRHAIWVKRKNYR